MHMTALSAQPHLIFCDADVYGWDLKNARLFADAVARAGFTCALPDFFHGDKLPGAALLRCVDRRQQSVVGCRRLVPATSHQAGS